MDIKNKAEVDSFNNLLTGVAETFEKTLSPSMLKVYLMALRGYQLSDIKRAMSYHLMNPEAGKWMPKPADIIRAIDGDTGSRSAMAWTKADKGLRIHGPYSDIVFDDPIIHRVIEDMGGWIHFCTRSTDKDYAFQQKEFETRYKGYANRPPEDFPRLLEGISGNSNAMMNIDHKQAPAIVGDANAAMITYQSGRSDDSQKIEDRSNAARIIMNQESGEKQKQLADLQRLTLQKKSSEGLL